MTVMCYLWV